MADNSQKDTDQNTAETQPKASRPTVTKKQKEEREIGVVTLFVVIAILIILIFVL